MTGYTYPIALKLACDAMHHLGMGPEEIEQVIETIKQRGGPAVRPRARSYRDPDLSDQWLHEAEWRARNTRTWPRDARKIILRLVQEIRKINREAGR